MNLKDAAAVAKEHLGALHAAGGPHVLRLESFLYDDHLMVWSLTIGVALNHGRDARVSKIVRVCEANKTVLSVKDA